MCAPCAARPPTALNPWPSPVPGRSLLPRQLNPAAGTLLGRYVRDAGIELRAKARTREILGDERGRS
jgi:hypothetical protein